MPQPRSRVDARRNAAAILDRAREVLADDPDANLTQIAEAAGVHAATVYRHYPTRDALIDALTAALAESLREKLAEADLESGSARDALRRATLVWLDNANDWKLARYSTLDRLPAEGARMEIRARMTALFERGQREGTLRDDLPPLTLHTAWSGLVTTWISLRADLEPEATADTILQVLLGAPSST